MNNINLQEQQNPMELNRQQQVQPVIDSQQQKNQENSSVLLECKIKSIKQETKQSDPFVEGSLANQKEKKEKKENEKITLNNSQNFQQKQKQSCSMITRENWEKQQFQKSLLNKNEKQKQDSSNKPQQQVLNFQSMNFEEFKRKYNSSFNNDNDKEQPKYQKNNESNSVKSSQKSKIQHLAVQHGPLTQYNKTEDNSSKYISAKQTKQEEQLSIEQKYKKSSVLQLLFDQLKQAPLPEPEKQDKSKPPQKPPRFQSRTYIPGQMGLVYISPFAQQKKWILGTGKTPDKLRLWSWNINGVRSKSAMKLLIHHSKTKDPDIICIIETKINYQAYKKEPIHFKGYNDYWCFCKCSAGYSGVAVFSKYPPIRVVQDLPQIQFSQQGRVLTLQFQLFFLVAVYIPASGDNLQRLFFKVKQYQVLFHNYCNALKKISNKRVIIAGDLNTARTELDASISKTTHLGQAYTPIQRKSLQDFLLTGWIDTFRHMHPSVKTISWWNLRRYGQKAIQLQKGKRLDYFLVDDGLIDAICSAKVLNHITGRDHCPVQLKLDMRYYLKEKLKLQSKNSNKINE